MTNKKKIEKLEEDNKDLLRFHVEYAFYEGNEEKY